MHCQYCGTAIPSTTKRCPNCGKMANRDQMNFFKDFNKNSGWDKYTNKNTSIYKSEKAYERNNKIGIIIVPLIILIIIIIALLKVIGN